MPGARWWRFSVRFRGHVVEEHRFDADARITVGEGGTSIVLPGVRAAALVEAGAVREVDGLALRERGDDGTYAFVPTAAPEVEVLARLEGGVLPSLGSSFRGPWRELAYGLAAAGCIASLVLVHGLASASPTGGPAPTSGRMERTMLAELDTPTPTVVTFAAPPQPIAIDAAKAEPVEPDPDATEPDDAKDPIPTFVPVEAPTEIESIEDASPEVTARRSRKQQRSAPRVQTPGEHSHTAEGQPEQGGGIGDAVAAAHACDDPRSEPKDHVDVVFVIDVSTTMAFALDRLAEEIAALDATVRSHDPDRRYGLVLFVDDVLVVDGNPYTDIAALQRDFRRWSRFTSTNRQLHSHAPNLDWPENGLDALVTAAKSFDWRDADDTLRLVVYASDDDFGEAGALQSGQRVHNDYADTVKALKSRSIRVASFTAAIGGECECDDVRGGFMAPYRGQPAIPVATGGASFDIDEVAAGRLHFDRALSGLVDNLVCDE